MAHLVVLRHLWVLRRNRPYWLIVNGVFEPFLYLMSIGVGIGQLVSLPPGSGPPGTTYAAFVAPALLATAAMNAAFNEAVGGVWFRLRFEHVYQSMLTTPMTVADLAVGEVAAMTLRATAAATCFLGVIVAFGMVLSWWTVLAIPAIVLITFAFAGAGLFVATISGVLAPVHPAVHAADVPVRDHVHPLSGTPSRCRSWSSRCRCIRARSCCAVRPGRRRPGPGLGSDLPGGHGRWRALAAGRRLPRFCSARALTRRSRAAGQEPARWERSQLTSLRRFIPVSVAPAGTGTMSVMLALATKYRRPVPVALSTVAGFCLVLVAGALWNPWRLTALYPLASMGGAIAALTLAGALVAMAGLSPGRDQPYGADPGLVGVLGRTGLCVGVPVVASGRLLTGRSPAWVLATSPDGATRSWPLRSARNTAPSCWCAAGGCCSAGRRPRRSRSALATRSPMICHPSRCASQTRTP